MINGLAAGFALCAIAVSYMVPAVKAKPAVESTENLRERAVTKK
jgi:hypothetical protein